MSMKAVVVHEYGDSSQLKYEDVPIPDPGEGEVLVKNAVCGVNFLDIYLRKNTLIPMPLPFTMGVEGAGTVEKLGPSVSGLAVGNRVAYVQILSGSYAEYSKVQARRAVKIPAEITFEQAATSMIQGITAQMMISSVYCVKPGDKVLVHAASGGTGSLICQVAKNAGAFVIGTTSTRAKFDKVKAAGADEVIVHAEQDFVQEVKRLTDGKGANVIYDGVGKATFLRGLDCLATRGTMVLFGSSSGNPDPLAPGLLGQGSKTLKYPVMFDFIEDRAELEERSLAVFRWIVEGKIKFAPFTVFLLAEASKAHDILEGGKSAGKILLKP